MARVSTYLNFDGKTEEAFNFYKKVFGNEFEGGIKRFGEMPPDDNMPPLPEEVKQQVLHVSLPILGGFTLMGSDAPQGMGFQVTMGNNVHINIETDSREQTDTLFAALSEGGVVTMALQDMFWGDYFGSCTDKFGVQWMVNCASRQTY
jgi:PhnB protein